MKPDKMHHHHCILFCFHQKKTAAETKKIICETYSEGVIAAHTCEEWFIQFRMV